MTLLGDVFDMCPLRDQAREGEHVFQLCHISTLAGPAPRSVKRIIASVYNSSINNLYNFLSPIEKEFNLQYWGRIDTLHQSSIAFVDKQTRLPVVFKASKLRKSSLAELSAQKVASELGNITDIELILEQRLIPASLKTILLKHI